MPDQSTELAEAIQEVTERAELLVREEIALAKAEMTAKLRKLATGAAFGIVAGVFAVFALIYLLDALSWGIWDFAYDGGDNLWFGFLITGVVILLSGLIAGFVAMRLIKKGTPPTPALAIEEAQLIKETLTAAPASHPVRREPLEVER